MAQKEKETTEESKQNAEDEELSEEDEEEKEQDKQDSDNKKEQKEINKDTSQEITEFKPEGENTNKEKKPENEKTEEKDKNEQKDEKEKNDDNKNSDKKEDTKETKTDETNIKVNANENEKEKNVSSDKKENEENEEEKEEEEKEQEESTSTYILKYTRKSNEPRESSYDRELIKSKHCLFMIEFKILKGKKDKFLLIYSHEIAAIYFDEIYEKKYSIKDLYKENRHFRIFDDVEEAKNIVDEILNNNTTNSKKIFIDLQDNNFRLHLKMTFFDKENEVIFNVPKKNITDKERIRLLPEFLKEIQIKMNHLEEENKKLKNESKNINVNDNELLASVAKSTASLGDENDFFMTKAGLGKKNKSGNGKGYKKKMIKK
jgi:hypothetical protein